LRKRNSVKKFNGVVGVMVLLFAVCALQFGRAQDKAAAHRSVRVQVHYGGSGAVDEKHRVLVFLFDSAEFIRGGAAPFDGKGTASKDGTVTFTDVAKSPVYVGTVYDPAGAYDGQSGPPPRGSSMGIYSKTAGEPAPVTVEAGKTASIEVPFDDTVKMP
jgi:hypothetical protein